MRLHGGYDLTGHGGWGLFCVSFKRESSALMLSGVRGTLRETACLPLVAYGALRYALVMPFLPIRDHHSFSFQAQRVTFRAHRGIFGLRPRVAFLFQRWLNFVSLLHTLLSYHPSLIVVAPSQLRPLANALSWYSWQTSFVAWLACSNMNSSSQLSFFESSSCQYPRNLCCLVLS